MNICVVVNGWTVQLYPAVCSKVGLRKTKLAVGF